MADDELRDRAGELIAGRYRLVKLLGAGGMGEVYRAVNELVGRDVAIKILKPEYAKSPDVVARVLREARASNAVRHPNVVDVIDVQTDDSGAPVIVQELLSGEDLAAHARSHGPFSEADALDLMIPITEALGAAHAAGIMHRDLKLENVFIDRRTGVGVPKVLDFGLSRGVGENAVSRLTATGIAMGTPMYMSPEQVQGQRDVDQRTDVWALGIMLYELVAGRLPFEGESLGAIFVKVCTADPAPLRVAAPGVSEGFEAVVARCLQRDRDQRYEHAGLLAEALRSVRSGASLGVSAVAPRMIDERAQTVAASSGSLVPAMSVPPPTGSTLRPQDGRGAMGQSIGPTVSAVPPAPRRGLRVASIAAIVVAAMVGGGAWLALGGGTSGDATRAAIATPRAIVRPAAPVVPAAPVAPLPAAGTTAYDNHPTPPVTGTPAYDPPAPIPAHPAEPVYDGASGAAAHAGHHGAHAPRHAGGHAHGAAHGHGAGHTAVPGGGTADYDQ